MELFRMNSDVKGMKVSFRHTCTQKSSQVVKPIGYYDHRSLATARKWLTFQGRQGPWRTKRERQRFQIEGSWWWMPKHWRWEGRLRGRTSSWIFFSFYIENENEIMWWGLFSIFLSFIETKEEKSTWNFGFLCFGLWRFFFRPRRDHRDDESQNVFVARKNKMSKKPGGMF